MKYLSIIIIMFFSTQLLSGKDVPTIKTVLFPFREAVIASQINSILLPYKFKVGEKFKRGEILLELDNSRYKIELSRANKKFDFARSTFKNKKELYEKKFTSDYELKKAEFDMLIAEDSLADAKLELSFCTIKAPFNGTIVEFLTKEYETTRPGQPLIKIIDNNYLLAVLNVPITDKNLTSVNNEIKLKLSDNNIITGKIYEVAPQADHRTGTVRIRVLIDNTLGKLYAGMTGEIVYE